MPMAPLPKPNSRFHAASVHHVRSRRKATSGSFFRCRRRHVGSGLARALADHERDGRDATHRRHRSHHQEGLAPAGTLHGDGDDQRVQHGADRGRREEDAQGDAEPLVEPALHELGEDQRRGAHRREGERDDQHVELPELRHERERGEVEGAEQHAGKEQRP
jgi:hypothetical protein